ncbi:hypothetical protein HAZT_HAZT006164 [Hyalella azteca]|uniref:Uncharacterized protein n=1 Tax=Hyalella azteca TaxID=294128 RepID=A0A6A0HB32_HYAAZ|nr:hypothetical protein HAZT_HAZT006164 [Hyalella azteca]
MYLNLSISMPLMLNHTAIHLKYLNRSALEDQAGVFFDTALLDDNTMPVDGMKSIKIWDGTEILSNGEVKLPTKKHKVVSTEISATFPSDTASSVVVPENTESVIGIDAKPELAESIKNVGLFSIHAYNESDDDIIHTGNVTIGIDHDLFSFISNATNDTSRGNLSIDEAGGSTTIMNVTGHVIVDEVSGVMSIVNVSGNVFVIGVSGRLHVQNVTGNLTVIGVRHRGDLIVDDVKGDLTINDVIGNVQIGHVTGMLRQLNTIRRGKQWQRRYGDHHHYQVRHSYELEEDDEEDEKEDEDDEEEENEEDYEYEYEGAEQEDEDSEEEEESNEAHEDLQKYLFKNNCTTRFNATPEDVDILCYVNGSLTSRLLSDIDLGSSSSSSSSSSEEGDGKSEDDNSEEDQSGELERDSAMEDDRDGNLISEEGLLSNERLSELGNRTRQAGDNSTNKLHSDVYDTGLSEEYSSEELNIIGGIDVGSAPATHGEIRLNDEFPSTVCYHPRMVERITHPLVSALHGVLSPTSFLCSCDDLYSSPASSCETVLFTLFFM